MARIRISRFRARVSAKAVAVSVVMANMVLLESPARAQSGQYGSMRIMQPWETVLIEHQDRMARLERLSGERLAGHPQFYQYLITQKELRIANFPADIPVLRVVFDIKVFFDFDKDVLRPDAVRVLDVVVDSLRKEPPDVALFIAGHTDAVGGDDYNYELGLRRARAVAQALVARNLSQVDIYRVSFGKRVPVKSNDTEQGRSENRRVEFLFGARSQAVAHLLARQDATLCAPKCRFEAVLESREPKIALPPALPPRLEAPASADPRAKAELPAASPKGNVDIAFVPKVDVAPKPERYVIDLGERRFEIPQVAR